jgi:hypothetical protein
VLILLALSGLVLLIYLIYRRRYVQDVLTAQASARVERTLATPRGSKGLR